MGDLKSEHLNPSQNILLPLLNKGRVENVLFRAQQGLRADCLEEKQISFELSGFPKNECIILPSHFFEYENKNELLKLIAGRTFMVQVSPGAELADYEDEIFQLQLLENFAGIELVMDRAPHLADWARLCKMRVARYVFCPVIEIDAMVEFRKLPKNILDKVCVCFPPKGRARDSFLSADASFVLGEKLVREGFPFRPIQYALPPKPLAAALPPRERAERQFLKNPTADSFVENFPLLGNNPTWRALAIRMAKNALTAPLILIPYGLLWMLNSPAAAAMTIVWRLRYFFDSGYWRVHDLADAAYLLSCRVFSIVRHTCVMSAINIRMASLAVFYFFHWIAYRIYALSFHVYHFFWRIFYFTGHFLIHPIWSIRQYLPIVYFIFIHPLFKAYWFFSYQIEKRMLRKLRDQRQ